MIHAILKGKAGHNFKNSTQTDHNTNERENPFHLVTNKDKLNWRESFKTSEDSLTSMVFGRLFYLPDNILWEIIWKACGEPPEIEPAGRIKDKEFWPRWKSNENDITKSIEPDLYISFEKFDLIIEAKRYDSKQQDPDQWQREVNAYWNEYPKKIPKKSDGGSKLYLLALGCEKPEATKKIEGLEKVLFCKWSQLLHQVVNKLEELDGKNFEPRHLKDLLKDIQNSFELHGFFVTKWLNELPVKKINFIKKNKEEDNMQLNSDELNIVLADVRKSYRLLYHYQERVRSLVKYISDKLGFGYVDGNALFSHPWNPGRKDNLQLWAWDFLPMYYFEFHLGAIETNDGEVRASIFLQSDTGFFDSDKDNKLKPEDFSSIESSQTRLIFVVGKNDWNYQDFHSCSKEILKRKKEGPIMVKGKGDSYTIAKAYNLIQFANAELTDKTIDDFKDFCLNQGIGFLL